MAALSQAQVLTVPVLGPALVEATDTRVEPRVINVYALPPPMRESGVPTVEHDGQRHTLH
jgi:hypothetical protein